MASFVAHGHRVHLHVYEAPSAVPAGVVLQDAERILPMRHVFVHKQSGSFAVFADWFRYRLLYEQGGIWADTDVVCLAPLNFPTQEVFAWMDQTAINNAVLGLPSGHPLAQWMAECCQHPHRVLPYDDARTRRRKWKRRLLQGNARGNIRWGETGPDGFTAAARHFGLHDKALPFWHFYPIHYQNWRCVFDGSLPHDTGLLTGCYALHLWNEMSRRDRNFDKNARFPSHSLFEQLCARYLTSDN